MASSSKADTDAYIKCSNCQRDISVASFELHEAHCRRHIILCEICQEPIPIREKDEHFQENHAPAACEMCGNQIPKHQLNEHMEQFCPERKVECKFCQLDIRFPEFDSHIEACGSRTDHCEQCLQRVMLKEMEEHKLMKCGRSESPGTPPEDLANMSPYASHEYLNEGQMGGAGGSGEAVNVEVDPQWLETVAEACGGDLDQVLAQTMFIENMRQVVARDEYHGIDRQVVREGMEANQQREMEHHQLQHDEDLARRLQHEYDNRMAGNQQDAELAKQLDLELNNPASSAPSEPPPPYQRQSSMEEDARLARQLQEEEQRQFMNYTTAVQEQSAYGDDDSSNFNLNYSNEQMNGTEVERDHGAGSSGVYAPQPSTQDPYAGHSPYSSPPYQDEHPRPKTPPPTDTTSASTHSGEPDCRGDKVPCQFCKKLFPFDNIMAHQQRCNADYEAGNYPPSHAHPHPHTHSHTAPHTQQRVDIAAILRRSSESEDELVPDAELPCQFCGEAYSVRCVEAHQALCERNPDKHLKDAYQPEPRRPPVAALSTTTSFHPPAYDAHRLRQDDKIPCEFCGESYPTTTITMHQTICFKSPTFQQRMTSGPERRFPGVGPSAAASPGDKVLSLEKGPCEFCDQLIPLSELVGHQATCQFGSSSNIHPPAPRRKPKSVKNATARSRSHKHPSFPHPTSSAGETAMPSSPPELTPSVATLRPVTTLSFLPRTGAFSHPPTYSQSSTDQATSVTSSDRYGASSTPPSLDSMGARKRHGPSSEFSPAGSGIKIPKLSSDFLISRRPQDSSGHQPGNRKGLDLNTPESSVSTQFSPLLLRHGTVSQSKPFPPTTHPTHFSPPLPGHGTVGQSKPFPPTTHPTHFSPLLPGHGTVGQSKPFPPTTHPTHFSPLLPGHGTVGQSKPFPPTTHPSHFSPLLPGHGTVGQSKPFPPTTHPTHFSPLLPGHGTFGQSKPFPHTTHPTHFSPLLPGHGTVGQSKPFSPTTHPTSFLFSGQSAARPSSLVPATSDISVPGGSKPSLSLLESPESPATYPGSWQSSLHSSGMLSTTSHPSQPYSIARQLQASAAKKDILASPTEAEPKYSGTLIAKLHTESLLGDYQTAPRLTTSPQSAFQTVPAPLDPIKPSSTITEYFFRAPSLTLLSSQKPTNTDGLNIPLDTLEPHKLPLSSSEFEHDNFSSLKNDRYGKELLKNNKANGKISLGISPATSFLQAGESNSDTLARDSAAKSMTAAGNSSRQLGITYATSQTYTDTRPYSTQPKHPQVKNQFLVGNGTATNAVTEQRKNESGIEKEFGELSLGSGTSVPHSSYLRRRVGRTFQGSVPPTTKPIATTTHTPPSFSLNKVSQNVQGNALKPATVSTAATTRLPSSTTATTRLSSQIPAATTRLPSQGPAATTRLPSQGPAATTRLSSQGPAGRPSSKSRSPTHLGIPGQHPSSRRGSSNQGGNSRGSSPTSHSTTSHSAARVTNRSQGVSPKPGMNKGASSSTSQSQSKPRNPTQASASVKQTTSSKTTGRQYSTDQRPAPSTGGRTRAPRNPVSQPTGDSRTRAPHNPVSHPTGDSRTRAPHNPVSQPTGDSRTRAPHNPLSQPTGDSRRRHKRN